MPAGKKQKADIVLQTLQEYMPKPEVPLHHSDAFTLLVAVMLSARCTDVRVNEVTPTLFALAPDAATMAATPWEDIRRIIAPCGLSDTKAQRLVETSRLLLERHNGRVPSTFEELEALPGVGHKTASVVMTQAFGHPAFPVDTHIYRLARRWGLSRGNSVEKVEADLKKLFPRDTWGKLHLQIVLWGRQYCPARGCKPACPVCERLAQQ
ncbi:MAG: endonuclease III [Akkermansia sp.]|nr:endonuclease III [Akkermansia sp.]